VGGSPQRQILDSTTQPNRSVEMMRRRLRDGSTCRISVVDMPIIVSPYCTSHSLYSSFSARINRRSVRLESQVVLCASLILHESESAFYYILARLIMHKKNIYIETGTYDALFRWSSWFWSS
jgi:hypothetical protein